MSDFVHGPPWTCGGGIHYFTSGTVCNCGREKSDWLVDRGGGNAESGGRNKTGGEAPAVPTPSEENSPVGGTRFPERELRYLIDQGLPDIGRAITETVIRVGAKPVEGWDELHGFAMCLEQAITAHAELRDRYLTEKAQWKTNEADARRWRMMRQILTQEPFGALPASDRSREPTS